MWRKLVCAGGILLLLFAVATSVFNLVSIHELSGNAGSDIGTNRGNINLLVVENVVMRDQIEKNLETMAKISVILDAMSITIIHNAMDTTSLEYDLMDLETNIDKLNAVIQASEYHHEFEYKKKIAENREKLIAEGIWKKNERQ
jgi:cell division protein FtsL